MGAHFSVSFDAAQDLSYQETQLFWIIQHFILNHSSIFLIIYGKSELLMNQLRHTTSISAQFISSGKTSCHSGWTVFQANYDQQREAATPFFGALSESWANESWEPTLFLWKGLSISRREKHLCTPLAFVQMKILPCCSERVTLQSQRRSHTVRQSFRRPGAFAGIASSQQKSQWARVASQILAQRCYGHRAANPSRGIWMLYVPLSHSSTLKTGLNKTSRLREMNFVLAFWMLLSFSIIHLVHITMVWKTALDLICFNVLTTDYKPSD